MSLVKELNEIHRQYLDELNLVKEFVEKTEKYISRKQRVSAKNKLNGREIEKLSAVLNKMIVWPTDKPDKKSLYTEISDKGLDFILFTLISFKQKVFLAEMTLSYLITFQEGFIKDYLMSIFIHRKSILKSSKKITYEEILSFRSVKSLTSFMAQKEVESLGYGSIDDIKEKISKKFKIDISGFKKWKNIREANYRRNIIIHNKAITNDTYCKKTGYKKSNHHIDTSVAYISKTTNVLLQFFDFFHLSFCKKLQL